MTQYFSSGVGLGLAALLVSPSLLLSHQAGAAVINHHYDWDTAYSNVNMCRPISSGESLADMLPAQPPVQCAEETALGDILVAISWSDGEFGSAIWGSDAGNGLPGVTVTSTGGYSARLSQTGDTFSLPWTLSNLAQGTFITEVVMTARGTPDMGFDTDAGNNPGHGAGGYPLFLDASSVWDGTLEVFYDLWNDWNDTTDIFHRMTLAFDDQTPVASGADIVFYQDTDEIPLPSPAVLLLPGLAGLAWGRRTRWRANAGR